MKVIQDKVKFLIDIIIPTFNRSEFIDRAVNSVLAQSFRDFQLYVVDDGSTDDTESVLRKFSQHPQVKILKQSNLGVSAARNLGIKNSQSEWIAFLDSDDEWLPQKLAVQVAFLQQHPKCRFVHSNEIWMRNGVRVNAKKKFDKSNNEIFKRSLETCLISPSTVVIKRELLQEQGGFDESMIICEDYDLWLKILVKEEVGFISENLIKKYGGHSDQLSTQFHSMDFWRLKSLLKLSIHPDISPEHQKLVEEQIAVKTNLLKANYLKHQNDAGLAALEQLFFTYQS